MLALEGDSATGFAVVTDWKELPGAKLFEVIEVARSFRGEVIGSKVMGRLLSRWGTHIALAAQPEPGQEERLVRFYEGFGFKPNQASP